MYDPTTSPGRGWPGPHGKRLPGDLLEGAHQLPHGGAEPGAQVDGGAGLAGRDGVVEPQEGRHVGLGKVPHVDVVTDGGPVPRRPLRAGHRERSAVAVGVHELADDMSRVRVVGAGAQLRVGTDRVEVAKTEDPQAAHCGDIGEDALAHRLGRRIGAGRRDGGVLVDLEGVAGKVDRRRGAEDQPPSANPQQVTQERDEAGHVVAVVVERVPGGVGDHGASCAVHDGRDVRVRGIHRVNDLRVGDRPTDEGMPGGEAFWPLAQVVEDDRGDATVGARGRDGATDIAGSPRDQDLHRPGTRATSR